MENRWEVKNIQKTKLLLEAPSSPNVFETIDENDKQKIPFFIAILIPM